MVEDYTIEDVEGNFQLNYLLGRDLMISFQLPRLQTKTKKKKIAC